MKAAGPLAEAELPVAAGEHVAAEALVEVVVADQLTGVRVRDGPERLAGRFVEHHPVEIFAQCRGGDRLKPDRRHVPPDLGDIERLPCGGHELVDEIGRRIIFRPLLQFLDDEARRQ